MYVYHAYASDLVIAALRFWRQIFRYDLSGNGLISNLHQYLFPYSLILQSQPNVGKYSSRSKANNSLSKLIEYNI